MKTVELFNKTSSPLTVTQFALGCDYYGLATPEDHAFAILDAYYEAGGRFLDTAHIYAQEADGLPSHSEQTLGKWIDARGVGAEIKISDKGAHPRRSDMSQSRINEKDINADLTSSLEALRRDSVDIWFLHRDNPAIPVGEIVDIVSELAEQGYVRHLGASNWTPERITAANEYAKANGKHGFDISQISWSLAKSTPESWEDSTLVCMNERQLPWYESEQFPVMAFSSQGRGIFSKTLAGEPISEKTRKRFLAEENAGRIERCGELCRQKQVNPPAVCLAYLTGAPFPVIPIIGCSSPEQVADTLRYQDFELSEAERRQLSE